MKVGLNATCFNDRPSGAKQRFVGIYGELIRQLPDVEFIVFEPADCNVASWFDGALNVSARKTPLPSMGRLRKFVGGLQYWRSALATEGCNLFEGFHLPLVSAPSGRTVMTIHDIRGMENESRILDRMAFKAVLGASLKVADQVVTVSESMKVEILRHFPRAPVSVIYNGLDTSVFDQISEADMQAVRRKYGFPQEFVLAVGHFESRKNYGHLVNAVARLRDSGTSCSLVIIGNDSGERAVIEKRIEAAKLSGCVKVMHGLSDLELRCAYKLSHLFVFPSFYEGFGIPILEAMAAERPMVLSDIPVFREITQGQGIYFRHDDLDAMASAIERGLTSSTDRDRLVKYGRERVRDFTFPRLAEQLEGLYRTLI